MRRALTSPFSSLADCILLLLAASQQVWARDVCLALEGCQSQCIGCSVREPLEPRSHPESLLQTASSALGQTTLQHAVADPFVEELGGPSVKDATPQADVNAVVPPVATTPDSAEISPVPGALLQNGLDDREASDGSHRKLDLALPETLLDRSQGATYAKTLHTGSVQVPAIVLGVALTCIIAGALLLAFFLNSSRDSELGEKAKAADRDPRAQPSVDALLTRSPGPMMVTQAFRGVAGPPTVDHGLSAATSPAVSGRQQQLCPGLVVPRGSECLLAVPTALMVVGETASFQVRDLGGKPVITVDLARFARAGAAEPAESPASSRAIAVVRAAVLPGKTGPGPALATCRASPNSGGERAVFILNGRQEVFASVAKTSAQSYVLSGVQGGAPQLKFEGDFANHTSTVSLRGEGTGVGQLLAETEPATMAFDQEGAYYRLRVCSGVDVGLLLCGLLAVGHMEAR